MKKKIIALILCICLISCTCIQPAYAMGAEGIIVGGGAAGAGVTLTMPQVALLVAAGFGLIYATQHAEEIAQGLNEALTNAANNIEGGIEQLTAWQEQSAKGSIAIASAPSWISATIKGWIKGIYDTPHARKVDYAAGEAVPSVDIWNGTTNTYNAPVTVLYAGNINHSGGYYHMTSMQVIISTEIFTGGCSASNINGVNYYYKYWSTGGSALEDSLAGSNLKMYEAISAMPSIEYIRAITEGTIGSDHKYRMIEAWLDGYYDNASVCPDQVGGIDDALGQHAIDNIKVPDLDIGGSDLLVPENVGAGSIDESINDILNRLKEQDLSWSDFMSDVAVGNPSVTINGKDYVIDDGGITDIPVEDVVPDNPTVEVPEGLAPFTISLTDFFPFCIPFDIVDFVNVLCAEPEAPRFDWTFTWYGGDTDTLTIDLSPFDQVAQLLRNMELLLFCIGLALITRNQIRG